MMNASFWNETLHVILQDTNYDPLLASRNHTALFVLRRTREPNVLVPPFPFLFTISQLTTLAAQQRVVNTSHGLVPVNWYCH